MNYITTPAFHMFLKFAFISGILHGTGHCFLLPLLAADGSSSDLLGVCYINTFYPAGQRTRQRVLPPTKDPRYQCQSRLCVQHPRKDWGLPFLSMHGCLSKWQQILLGHFWYDGQFHVSPCLDYDAQMFVQPPV